MQLVEGILRTLGGGDTPAVEYRHRWYTGGELRGAVDALDALLAGAGIGRGHRVGLVVRNDPAHLAALFAVLVSGRCLVLISPFQDSARLANELLGLGLAAIVADNDDWSVAVIESARESGALAVGLSSQPEISVRVVSAPTGGKAKLSKPVAHGI